MNWPDVIKKAKSCHSKQAWDQFCYSYSEKLSEINSSKVVEEIFKILRSDEHSLKYSEDLWCSLLSGCISCWNLGLGRDIALFIENLPCSKTRLKSAEIHLESGHPTSARKIAQKGLRLANLSEIDKISFKLIICKSYAEEGKHESAKRMLAKLEASVNETNLPSLKKAEMLINIARSKFFLGNYSDAAFLFSRSYRIYRFHKKWELAASSLFNSAASYDNSGMDFREKALALVSKCEALSEKHKLLGPLSHCLAFYATYYQQKGSFSEAIDYYRKALNLIPRSENSFRKLHIVSMLTFTLFKSGQFNLASRYGFQTLKLAQEDESERFKIRYSTLKSELDWQKGDIATAYDNLTTSYKALETNGVHTLEELSTLSRFNIKSAQINICTNPSIFIAKSLRNNNATWLEYRISIAYQALTRNDLVESSTLGKVILRKSQEFNFRYFESQSLSLLLMIKIKQLKWDSEFFLWLNLLEEMTKNKDFKVFRAHVGIVKASYNYFNGSFAETVKLINESHKLSGLPMQKFEVLNAWRHTICGSAPRYQNRWKASLVVTATNIYFSPTLEKISEHSFLVSKRYEISLKNYPVLNRLLNYLMTQKNFSTSPQKIQLEVWRQPLTLQGWQQKIRNSITRLRGLFPQTLVPLVLIDGDQIRLFSEAIKIVAPPKAASNTDIILELLEKGPQSTIQLSNAINASQSTTKRMLKQLLKSKKVDQYRNGRNILYASKTATQSAQIRLSSL